MADKPKVLEFRKKEEIFEIGIEEVIPFLLNTVANQQDELDFLKERYDNLLELNGILAVQVDALHNFLKPAKELTGDAMMVIDGLIESGVSLKELLMAMGPTVENDEELVELIGLYYQTKMSGADTDGDAPLDETIFEKMEKPAGLMGTTQMEPAEILKERIIAYHSAGLTMEDIARIEKVPMESLRALFKVLGLNNKKVPYAGIKDTTQTWATIREDEL